MKKLFAFTLSETLITLGIIGVVATLTLPNVMTQYKNKVYVAQLQKVYNQFANAAVQKISDERVDTLAYTDLTLGSASIEKFFKDYFKISVDCGTSTTTTDCFAASYKSLDKSLSNIPGWRNWGAGQFYCVMLNTSASVCMKQMTSDDEDGRHGEALVLADVNGPAAPNVGGRDLFGFTLYSDGTVSDGYRLQPSKCELAKASDASAQYGSHCIDRIISDGWKMDY